MKKCIILLLDLIISILKPVSIILPKFIWLFFYDVLSIVPTRLGVALRYIVIKILSKNSGSNIYIGRFVTIKSIHNLSIGDNVSIHECSYIDAQGGISIGDNVSIAHNTSIISFNHGYKDHDKPIKYNELVLKSVVIENDVWVGCGCRILSGSKLSTRTVIGAGSVVTSTIQPNTIFAGIPARKIRDI